MFVGFGHGGEGFLHFGDGHEEPGGDELAAAFGVNNVVGDEDGGMEDAAGGGHQENKVAVRRIGEDGVEITFKLLFHEGGIAITVVGRVAEEVEGGPVGVFAFGRDHGGRGKGEEAAGGADGEDGHEGKGRAGSFADAFQEGAQVFALAGPGPIGEEGVNIRVGIDADAGEEGGTAGDGFGEAHFFGGITNLVEGEREVGEEEEMGVGIGKLF